MECFARRAHARGFAPQCRGDGGEFFSRENAGNECAGANPGMAAAWADSFPARSDTPFVPLLPMVDSLAKPTPAMLPKLAWANRLGKTTAH
jgi:hypothetical protein